MAFVVLLYFARTYYSAMTLNQLFTAACGTHTNEGSKLYGCASWPRFWKRNTCRTWLIKCIIILQMMELQCSYNYKCSEIMKCQIGIQIHVPNVCFIHRTTILCICIMVGMLVKVVRLYRLPPSGLGNFSGNSISFPHHV